MIDFMEKAKKRRDRSGRTAPWFRCLCGSMAAAVLTAGCGSLQGNEPSGEETMRFIQPAAVGSAGMEGASDAEGTGSAGMQGASDAEGTGSVEDNQNPEAAAEPEITLVMVGDILLHTPVAESGKGEAGYDFSAVFAPMKEEIEGADLALVNQEVILGGEELGISGYPNFNAPYELGDALADAGFDVVLHATNHALDKGKQGLQIGRAHV